VEIVAQRHFSAPNLLKGISYSRIGCFERFLNFVTLLFSCCTFRYSNYILRKQVKILAENLHKESASLIQNTDSPKEVAVALRKAKTESLDQTLKNLCSAFDIPQEDLMEMLQEELQKLDNPNDVFRCGAFLFAALSPEGLLAMKAQGIESVHAYIHAENPVWPEEQNPPPVPLDLILQPQELAAPPPSEPEQIQPPLSQTAAAVEQLKSQGYRHAPEIVQSLFGCFPNDSIQSATLQGSTLTVELDKPHKLYFCRLAKAVRENILQQATKEDPAVSDVPKTVKIEITKKDDSETVQLWPGAKLQKIDLDQEGIFTYSVTRFGPHYKVPLDHLSKMLQYSLALPSETVYDPSIHKPPQLID